MLHAPFVVEFKPPTEIEGDPELEALENEDDDDELGVKVINRKVITELPYVDELLVKNEDSERGKKAMKIKVMGLGIPPVKLTPSRLPSVDAESLRVLAG